MRSAKQTRIVVDPMMPMRVISWLLMRRFYRLIGRRYIGPRVYINEGDSEFIEACLTKGVRVIR